MDHVELHLHEKQLKTIGRGSLVGKVVHLADLKPIRGLTAKLLFHNTTMTFKRKNNGPREYQLAEHVPYCIAQGILELLAQGVKVEVYLVEDEDDD